VDLDGALSCLVPEAHDQQPASARDQSRLRGNRVGTPGNAAVGAQNLSPPTSNACKLEPEMAGVHVEPSPKRQRVRSDREPVPLVSPAPGRVSASIDALNSQRGRRPKKGMHGSGVVSPGATVDKHAGGALKHSRGVESLRRGLIPEGGSGGDNTATGFGGRVSLGEMP
jgi:hypothetical protein